MTANHLGSEDSCFEATGNTDIQVTLMAIVFMLDKCSLADTFEY